MSERLKVVANKDLTLDASLWEETDGARTHQISHPARLTGTVIGLGLADANDRGPIIEGETTLLAFP
jgi:hypothetical protein